MTLSLKKLTMLVVLAFLSFMMYSTKQRHDIIESLVAYSASDKPDSELIADFAACLKQQTVALPLRSVECSRDLTPRYGPAATYRIDVIAKTLNL